MNKFIKRINYVFHGITRFTAFCIFSFFAYIFYFNPFAVIILGIPTIIFAMVFSVSEGLIIDLETNRYKHYVKIFGIRFRGWDALPKHRRVIVVIEKEAFNADMYINRSVVISVFKAKLLLNDTEDIRNQESIMIARGKNKKQVWGKAEAFADYLKVSVEDFTER